MAENRYYLNDETLENLITSDFYDALPDTRQLEIYGFVTKNLKGVTYHSEEEISNKISSASDLTGIVITPEERAVIIENLINNRVSEAY